MKTIKKSIDINAPKEKVWDIFLNDKFTRIWYAEFKEGSRAETDWKEGSKAVFTDGSGNGILGKIIVNKPYEAITIEYEGFVMAGKEDYYSEGAKDIRGGRETYLFSEKGSGVTHVSIECDMSEKYFESMSAAWEKALQKVKELCEAN